MRLHLVSFSTSAPLSHLMPGCILLLFFWYVIDRGCSWWFNLLTCLDCSKHSVQYTHQWLTILAWLLRHLKYFKIITLKQTGDIRNWLCIWVFIVQFKNVESLWKSWVEIYATSYRIKFKLRAYHPISKLYDLVATLTNCILYWSS